jgi:hypothetical protein
LWNEGWGEFTLYFGCRRSGLDNIYEKEIKPLVKDGIISKFYLALSREPDIPKIYVQDMLKSNAVEVYRQIVEQDGHIYVCGDVSMASQVNTTVKEIIQRIGNQTIKEARNFVLKLREMNCYHEDIYGVTLQTAEVTGKMQMESLRSQGLLKAVCRFKAKSRSRSSSPEPQRTLNTQRQSSNLAGLIPAMSVNRTNAGRRQSLGGVLENED